MAGLGFEMRAIDAVAQQRMTDMGEVHPDLMGAAGLKLAGEQRRHRFAVAPVKELLDFPVGDRLAAGVTYRHFLPGVRMAVDRRIDGAALAVRHSPYERHVAAPHRAPP